MRTLEVIVENIDLQDSASIEFAIKRLQILQQKGYSDEEVLCINLHIRSLLKIKEVLLSILDYQASL